MSLIPGYDWVAVDYIWFPNTGSGPVLAFSPGQLVPNSTVDDNGWALGDSPIVVAWPGNPDPAFSPSVISIAVGEVA